MRIERYKVESIENLYKDDIRSNELECSVDFCLELDEDAFDADLDEIDVMADDMMLCSLSHLNAVIHSLERLRDITEMVITNSIWR